MATAANQNVPQAVGAPDLNIMCQCGAGLCHVSPIVLNPRFLFVCCPSGQADDGGCGFMQWRDTVENTIVATTWPSPPRPSTPPRTEATQASQNSPQKMCSCGVGPFSVDTARDDKKSPLARLASTKHCVAQCHQATECFSTTANKRVTVLLSAGSNIEELDVI